MREQLGWMAGVNDQDFMIGIEDERIYNFMQLKSVVMEKEVVVMGLHVLEEVHYGETKQ